MKKIMQNETYLLNKGIHLTDDDIILPKGKIVKIKHIDTDGFLTIETMINNKKIVFNSLKNFFLSEIPNDYVEPLFTQADNNMSALPKKGDYVENKKEILSINKNEIYFPGQKFIIINKTETTLSLLTRDSFGNYVTLETEDVNDFVVSETKKETILQNWIAETKDLHERDVLQDVIYVIGFVNKDKEVIVKAKLPASKSLIIGDDKSTNSLYFDILSVIKNTILPVNQDEEKNYLLRNFSEYIYSKQDCFSSFKKFIDFKNKQVYNQQANQASRKKL